MEDSKIIKLARAIITVLVFFTAIVICMKVLVLKSEDGIKQMESFYLQEEGTVDALLVGSSHIYCDVNTGVLWDEYGISAYDLGGAEQPYWNTYYFLKEALKYQTPKVIVLDVTIPGIRSVEYQPEVWSVTNLYGIRWNKNRIDATRASTEGDMIFNRIINPFNTMHTRYDELKKDDFIDENRSINYKGFDMREAVVPFEMQDMSDENEQLPITEKEEDYLRKIIDFTKEKKIPLLMVSVPFPVQNYENAQKIYNYEFAIAEEEGIAFIDFNKGYYDKIGLDFEKDFADEFHLNTTGNEKFTKYLGGYLKEQYKLADHRGDTKYSSWDIDALNQRQEVAWVRLLNAETKDEYFANLQNDKYIIYMSYGDNTDEAGILKTLYGGEVIYESKEETQKAFLDLDDMKLQLMRDDSDDGYITSRLMVNEKEYSLNTSGIKVLVYDSVLKRVVSEKEFDS